MSYQPLAGSGSDALWLRLSDLIADLVGLHFPRERFDDLQRSLVPAAAEFQFDDTTAFAEWLLSRPLTRAQLDVLAAHLTIGETYFFREKKTLEVISTRVLPDLIAARRGRIQRLRLWSAACCTGEEAYSLAILVYELLPDLADWHVTILATDINPRFLRRAAAAEYGEWSFRDTPSGFKERYFSPTGRRYTIRPEIQKLVTFEHLNLVADGYPSLTTDTNAMDVIFCRNVLMYFTPGQIAKVVSRLQHALVDGGWLAVSPSEASQAVFHQFSTRNFPGVILYQKSNAPSRDVAPPWVPPARVVYAPGPPLPATPPTALPVETRAAPQAVAASLYDLGRYGEAADTLLASVTSHTPNSETYSLLSRALANQGRLAEALTWCDRWVAAAKMDAAGHYVRAAVLLESGQQDAARRSLQRSLYLDPGFVLAHFALANLARSRNESRQADQHFANALHLLAGVPPDHVLPESDGLTAGRLTETITAMTAMDNTR